MAIKIPDSSNSFFFCTFQADVRALTERVHQLEDTQEDLVSRVNDLERRLSPASTSGVSSLPSRWTSESSHPLLFFFAVATTVFFAS